MTSCFRPSKNTKTSFEDGDPHENDGMLSGGDLDGEEWPDADELDNFCCNEQNAVGYDSAEEDIWIWPGDLAHPFDEAS